MDENAVIYEEANISHVQSRNTWKKFDGSEEKIKSAENGEKNPPCKLHNIFFLLG